MANVWGRLTEVVDRFFPLDSPRRKVVQLVSVVLLVEGISVLLLFSYVGPLLGLISILLGAGLMALFFRAEEEQRAQSYEPLGMRIVSTLTRSIGGEYALMVLGAVLIILVVLYNAFVSETPDYGDVDVIIMVFSGLLIVFPFVPDQWRIEATFAVVFIGFVTLLLAVPQAITSLGGEGDASSIGNWYVHYMLAAPFASILDLLGIPSSSIGNLVTLQFQDGSIHTLEISAYCAGLYSFSIFLSAFFSYVLVLEKLRASVLAAVLGLGVLVAYLGNLFRMVVVGVVGYYWGIEALHWAHQNAGWIIFISWSALFWWIILSRFSSDVPAREGQLSPEATREHEETD
ncbi:MAG: exosortase/archaeosortase family protein [Candidatus Thermoplasmatota archaeon]